MMLPGKGWPVVGSVRCLVTPVLKLPALHAGSGTLSIKGIRGGFARAFVVGKEEQLVFLDRTAERRRRNCGRRGTALPPQRSCARLAGCRCSPRKRRRGTSLVPDFETTWIFPAVENSAGATAVSILTSWIASMLGCTGLAPCGKAITAMPSMVGRMPTCDRVPCMIGVELAGNGRRAGGQGDKGIHAAVPGVAADQRQRLHGIMADRAGNIGGFRGDERDCRHALQRARWSCPASARSGRSMIWLAVRCKPVRSYVEKPWR